MICNRQCPFHQDGYCNLLPRVKLQPGNQCVVTEVRIQKIKELMGEERSDKCLHLVASDGSGKCSKCGIVIGKV